MDKRDGTTWVVVGLAPLGQIKIEDGSLERTLRADLGVDSDFPIFIPAITIKKGHRTSTIYLMEGYVFVASGLMPETRYFRLEDKSYVEQVLSSQSTPNGIRTLSVIPDNEIEKLKLKLRDVVGADVEVGDTVSIVEGTYRGLEGQVEGKDKDSAYVRFSMRSINLIAGIPLVFLDLIREESVSLDIPITPSARKYGYVLWGSELDTAIGNFIPESTVDIWLGEDHIGLKNIDKIRRRIYVSREKIEAISKGKKAFVMEKRPRGGIMITCK